MLQWQFCLFLLGFLMHVWVDSEGPLGILFALTLSLYSYNGPQKQPDATLEHLNFKTFPEGGIPSVTWLFFPTSLPKQALPTFKTKFLSKKYQTLQRGFSVSHPPFPYKLNILDRNLQSLMTDSISDYWLWWQIASVTTGYMVCLLCPWLSYYIDLP